MLDEAWSLIERFRLAHLFHTSYAHLAAGWIHRERGELAEAESSLVASQEHVEQWKDIPIAVQHTELTSRTRWSLGDRVAPPDLLDQAERLTSGRPASSHFPDRIDLARARLDLLDGEPVHAARRLPGWRSRLDGGAGTPRERILLARLAVASGGAVPDSSPFVPALLTTPLPRNQAVRASGGTGVGGR